MNFQNTLTISVCNLGNSEKSKLHPTWRIVGRWSYIGRPKAICTHAHDRGTSKRGPSILDRTVQVWTHAVRLDSCARTGRRSGPLISRWTHHRGPRRANSAQFVRQQSVAAASLPGVSPARDAVATPANGQNGSAIVLRTRPWPGLRRRWATAAARRDGAEGQLLETWQQRLGIALREWVLA